MHKMQRDFYLSLAAMLAQALVVGLSIWIHKYDKLLSTKTTETKIEKQNENSQKDT